MIPVPSNYNAYSDIRTVDFSMSFGVIAVEAADMAVASSDTPQFEPSQIQQTHDRVEITGAPFATLEHNIWTLDGSMSIYPADLTGLQTGYVSEDFSNDSGSYATDPDITFTFEIPQDSYGLTFCFDNRIPYSWPREMTLTYYGEAGNQIQQVTLQPDGYNYWADVPVQNYSKLTVVFGESMVPHRRVRLVELTFGLTTRYGRTAIVSASDQQSIDVLSENLASAELTVTIDNSDKLYNLINPTGVYEYLQNGQYVNYWYSVNGITVNAGIRYFYSAESDDNGLTASITFNDRLIFLDDVMYNKGKDGSSTLSALVEDILITAGITTPPTFEPDAFGTIRTCIPQNTSAREAIRMCAQAAMCSCYVDANDSLHFFKPKIKDTPDDQLTRDRISEEPTVSIGDRYNAVTVKRSNSYEENSKEESYTLSAAGTGEIVIEKEISNDLIVNLEQWAEWALPWIQRRTTFDIEYRGNPAIEMGDTVQVYDAFRVNGMAYVESYQLDFDGGLSGSLTARRI